MQDYSVARRAMIDSQLRPQGVTDGGVLAAMGVLAREDYVPEAARAFAYFDRPLKVSGDRAMMPPAAIGRLLSELAPRPGERALVVGAATGYSAALLGLIGLDVTATEEDSALAATAREMGVDISASADGAPYDLILIDGAIEYVPEELVGRLVEGGRLGTALLDRGVSRIVVGRAVSGRLGLRTIVDADVTPLPGFERRQTFTF